MMLLKSCVVIWLSVSFPAKYAESLGEGKTSVPNTPACYVYNNTACEAAKANMDMSEEKRKRLCTQQKHFCETAGSSLNFNTCVTVWKQNINDSLPEHTDQTFESTIFMACHPHVSTGQTDCGNTCVAVKLGPDNVTQGTRTVSCCCTGSYCNDYRKRSLNLTAAAEDVETTVIVTQVSGMKPLYLGLIIAAIIGVVGTGFLVLIVLCMHRRRRQAKHCEDEHPLEDKYMNEEATLEDAGLSLQAEIAQGRYAKVHQGGQINGVPVAIKCFTAANRRMWQQERDVYRIPGMKNNSNIAKFFGVMQNGTGNDMTMWIVVQYYSNGAIYDYLKGHILTWPVMLKLAHSMMNGLAYLHNDLVLPDGQRRFLAHRDIKSRNILIKDDMTAAIADFGLAQCFKDGHFNESDAQFQAGTHRYMAPEVLDGAISFTKDAFLRIDIYAAALVLWELLTRCEVSENRSAEYKAPYEDMEIGRHTSLLETLQVAVSKENKRPSFPDCLRRNPNTLSLITTIEDSWDADAEARLSAGCIELRLAELLAMVSTDTELNNIRNLEPPPYNQVEAAVNESATLLIDY